VFGAEIGEGVEIAQSNFGETENLHFVQASVTDLPFAEGIFDFILCDGVLHHTSTPRETFEKLCQFLKPDGEIAIYVYHVGNPLRELTDSFFTEALSNKSMQENLAVSRTLTELAQELAESDARVIVPSRLEMLDINPGEYSLHELVLWKIIKLHWNPAVGFEKNWATNFDWFAPVNAFRFTGDEIIGWFNGLGLEILHSDINQGGISIRAKKV
jgi:SAM-dependent methyltransferase